MGKNKRPGRKEEPRSRNISAIENPNSFLYKTPSWKFCMADSEKWSPLLQSQGMADNVLPKMYSLEGMTWNEILKQKKQHHSIECSTLNSCAQKRLEELRIEAESVFSLRIQGRERLYGLIQEDGIFQIIWYDADHGDNASCVCRSHKKHT